MSTGSAGLPNVGYCRYRNCYDYSYLDCLSNSSCSYVGDYNVSYDFYCYPKGKQALVFL